jgi:aromatic ring-cleaving dioxygenase
MEAISDTTKIESYHAHVYCSDAASREAAAWLREALQQRFEVRMGHWHDEPVGPHPLPMYQVSFETGEFARIVPWLMLNRNGLTILVHPNTDDGYRDHAEHALWLGAKLELRFDVLRRLLDQ